MVLTLVRTLTRKSNGEHGSSDSGPGPELFVHRSCPRTPAAYPLEFWVSVREEGCAPPFSPAAMPDVPKSDRRPVWRRRPPIHQPALAVGSGEWAQGSLFLSAGLCGRGVLRQHDCCGVSEEAGQKFGSGPQRCRAEYSALGGTADHLSDATVCSRSEQWGGRRLVSPQSGDWIGVDAPSGGVRPAPQALAGNNTTAVAYLRRQGRNLAPALNAVEQRILHWTEQQTISLMPQFVPGRNNGVADALSRPNQVIGSEWMLHQEVFDWLRKRWPVTTDLFASSLSHHCSVYFAPVSNPLAAGTDAMLQSWDSLQVYAFTPFAMFSQVLTKVRASQSLSMTLIAPFWPQRPWFPELLELLSELPLPSRWDLLR